MEFIGYRPHSGQLKLHNSLDEAFFYYTFNIGRQWGKTMMVINEMFKIGLVNNGVDIGFVAPTLKQSKRVLMEMIKYAGGNKFFTANKSDYTFTFGNKSTITFLSSEQGDTIRGYHFHYMFRDESAFMPNDFYHEIIAPTMVAKGIKDISISTPKGRNSDHFKRYAQGLDNPLYFSHTAPSTDNPFLNKIVLDDIKKQTPDHIWRQEYLAEFLDGGTLFKNIDACVQTTLITPVGSLFGGLDIGRADDYTVLTIVDEELNVIHVERWRHDEWANIVNKVANLIKQYQAVTNVEVNNQGDVVYEMLENLVGKNLVQPFYTSANSKQSVIESLIVHFENKEISIPKIDWLNLELESFTYVYSASTRRVRYSAPSGLHDDGVISLALACESRKTNKRKGKYVFGY